MKIAIISLLLLFAGLGCSSVAPPAVSLMKTSPRSQVVGGSSTSVEKFDEDYFNQKKKKIWERYTVLVNTSTYHDTVLGYSLTLPAGWVVPSVTSTDAQFSENNRDDCILTEYRPNCTVLEVQKADYLASKGVQNTFQNLKKDGQNPQIMNSLIADAVVIKANSPGAAEGFSFEYDVILKNRAFVIFTTDDVMAEEIIASLKIDRK